MVQQTSQPKLVHKVCIRVLFATHLPLKLRSVLVVKASREALISCFKAFAHNEEEGFGTCVHLGVSKVDNGTEIT